MTYRSDLYNVANIIGYTGAPHRLPTVYFRCDTLQLCGRITQQHKFPFNVGREEPHSTVGYQMRNEVVAGRTVLREYRNGELKHTSRNRFISIVDDQLDPNPRHGVDLTGKVDLTALPMLAQALRRCPDQKDCAGIGQYGRMDLHCAIAQKHNMLHELSRHIHVIGEMQPSLVKTGTRFLDAFRAPAAVGRTHRAAMAKRGV